MRVHCQKARVPLLGSIVLAATAHGVVAVGLDGDLDALREQVRERFPDAEFKGPSPVTRDACREIRGYLTGGPAPDVEVVIPEKGFDARVWRRLARIPLGRTVSYGRLANQLRRPGAARAVGRACGRNPVPLIIPCHRVVTADGRLGGFSAGTAIKRKLLRLEGVAIPG